MTASWLAAVAVEAYPHRSQLIDAGYAAEERSRQVLRAAFIAGAELMAEKAAEVADTYADEHRQYGWREPAAAEQVAARIRSLTSDEEER